MISRSGTLEEIAFIVCDKLRESGVTAVLTGGSAATVYAPTVYQSSDIDFVIEFAGPQSKGAEALAELGFTFRTNQYAHPETPFTIDFPVGPLAVGQDQIDRWSILEKNGRKLAILSPTDCVRDRLSAFYFWKDRTALSAAIGVAKAQIVDLDVIREWSIREGELPRFEEFVRLLNARS